MIQSLGAILTPGIAALLVVTGFVAGLFGSLLGLGGGWLMVPVMTTLGMAPAVSVGSSLAAIVVTTSVSAARYQRRGHLHLALSLAFGLPSALGVQLGKMTLQGLAALGADDLALGGFYVALLLYNGVTMLRQPPPARAADDSTKAAAPARLPAFGPKLRLPGEQTLPLYQPVLGGLLAGFLSGLLGIGGGIVLVPIMTRLFGLPLITAVATSLVAVLIAASYGAVSYGLGGHVDRPVALCLALGAVAGGYLGATVAPRVSERRLRRMFAALCALTATLVVLRLTGWGA